jgi:hypothetical protein
MPAAATEPGARVAGCVCQELDRIVATGEQATTVFLESVKRSSVGSKSDVLKFRSEKAGFLRGNGAESV